LIIDLPKNYPTIISIKMIIEAPVMAVLTASAKFLADYDGNCFGIKFVMTVLLSTRICLEVLPTKYQGFTKVNFTTSGTLALETK
jgi:hypothetical protein